MLVPFTFCFHSKCTSHAFKPFAGFHAVIQSHSFHVYNMIWAVCITVHIEDELKRIKFERREKKQPQQICTNI